MNPFLDFNPESDLSNAAAGNAAAVKAERIARRRAAAQKLVADSLRQNPELGQMIGGGRNGSFGDRPGVFVPSNTVASTLGKAAQTAMGLYEQKQADSEGQAHAAARDDAFKLAVGGASSNITAIPTDTAMQADPNSVKANLERGMDEQLASSTGVPASALTPAAVAMPGSGTAPLAPAQPSGNGDMSIRQLLQLAHDFPEESKGINTLLQAKSWEGRDAEKMANQFELQKMKLDQAAQQMASKVTSAHEMAELRHQYALELAQLKQQFTADQNAQYRNPAGYVAPGAANKPPSGYQWNPDGSGTLVAIPGGPATKLNAAQVTEQGKVASAGNAVTAARQAITDNPDAIGLKGYMPDAALQRLNPSGVKTRATLSDLGSSIINARSGAAVSAQEMKRLEGFLPVATDTPQAAEAKLDQLEARLAEKGYTIKGAKPAAATKRFTSKDGSVWELRNGQPVKVTK